jgi:hypothetical protein
MSLPVEIANGDGGRKTFAKVSIDNALFVSSVPARSSELAHNLQTVRKQYREYFADSSGSRALNVNGSSTPTTFNVKYNPLQLPSGMNVGMTRGIHKLRTIIWGLNLSPATAGDMRRFSDATAANTPLTVGFNVKLVQGAVTTNLFPTTVTMLMDFFKGNSSYQSFPGAISSGHDLLIMDMDFVDPVIIPAGSPDNLSVTIADNLSTIDGFEMLVSGWYEVE